MVRRVRVASLPSVDIDNPAPGCPPAPGSAPSAPTGLPWWRRARPDAVVLSVFVVGGLWLVARYLLDPAHRMSRGNPDDSVLMEWWFAHGAHTLTHLSNPFYSHMQGAPTGVNVASNASLLGLTLPLAPVTLWLGPHLTVILVTALSLAANAGAAYWLLSRHLVSSRAAAAIGGGFYGFAPGVIEHAQGQLHLVANFVLPFIVGYAWRLPQRPVRNGAILGLLVVWQVFIGEALLLVTVLGTATSLAVYAVARPGDARRQLRSFTTGAATAIAVALPLLAYPLWYAQRGPQHVNAVPPLTQTWSENVAAFVLHSGTSLTGSSNLSRIIGWSEQTTWFGWPLCLALALAVVVAWRTSLPARIATITGLAFALLAFGADITIGRRHTGIPGPWALIRHLPLFKMLPPGRMAYVTIGAAALLLALLCERIASWPVRNTRLIGYGLLAAALLPAAPMPLRWMPRAQPPHFLTDGTWRAYVHDGTTLINLPPPENYPGDGLEELAWQAQSNLSYAIPTGYSLYPRPGGPTSYNPPPRTLDVTAAAICLSRQPPTVTDTARAAALADLRYWHAAIVIVAAAQPCASTLRTYAEALLGPAQPIEDVWLWDVRSLTGA